MIIRTLTILIALTLCPSTIIAAKFNCPKPSNLSILAVQEYGVESYIQIIEYFSENDFSHSQINKVEQIARTNLLRDITPAGVFKVQQNTWAEECTKLSSNEEFPVSKKRKIRMFFSSLLDTRPQEDKDNKIPIGQLHTPPSNGIHDEPFTIFNVNSGNNLRIDGHVCLPLGSQVIRASGLVTGVEIQHLSIDADCGDHMPRTSSARTSSEVIAQSLLVSNGIENLVRQSRSELATSASKIEPAEAHNLIIKQLNEVETQAMMVMYSAAREYQQSYFNEARELKNDLWARLPDIERNQYLNFYYEAGAAHLSKMAAIAADLKRLACLLATGPQTSKPAPTGAPFMRPHRMSGHSSEARTALLNTN
jgi:hypothetical protein